MKPLVDQNLCIGCGTCESLCPEVFKVKEDGKAHVLEGVDYKKYEAKIQEAITSCPVQAISWKE